MIAKIRTYQTKPKKPKKEQKKKMKTSQQFKIDITHIDRGTIKLRASRCNLSADNFVYTEGKFTYIENYKENNICVQFCIECGNIENLLKAKMFKQGSIQIIGQPDDFTLIMEVEKVDKT